MILVRYRPRRLVSRAAVAAAVLAALMLTPPADALPLPLFDSGGARTASATSSPTPPSGGRLFDGESLQGATRIASTKAHKGAFGRGTSMSVVPGVPAGVYRMTARIRANTATRADLTSSGKMTGSYRAAEAWRTVATVLRVGATTSPVGVASWSPPDVPLQKVDVDWIHVAATSPGFTTAGPAIVDSAGTSFVPRGFNRPVLHTTLVSNGVLYVPSPESVHFYRWGATVVRIPLNQEYWLANCPTRVGNRAMSYRGAAISEVESATALGLLAIVELAVTERGKSPGCTPTKPPLLKEMPDARSLSFWGSVASTFKANQRVAFDLYNEPYGISDSVWRNGGTVTYTEGALRKSYQAVGMQALYNRVRAAGAQNLVFVSGYRWATDPRVVYDRPLDGYGLVVAPHSYCESACPDRRNPRLNPNIDVLNPQYVRERFPVVVTETGWSNPKDSRFNRLMIDWAKARGIGWVQYAWFNPTGGDRSAPFSLLQSWDETFPVAPNTFTKPPAKSGAPAWNELAPVRGARGFTTALVAE